jgi:hypothetical protein
MKYLVIIEQKGEGCDYTIGCGMAVQVVDIDDDATVDGQLAARMLDYYGDDDERQIASVRYMSLADVRTADLARFRTARDAAERAQAQTKIDAEEKALYERLRAKHGGC